MSNKAETPVQCYICKGELEFLGQVPIRTKGTGAVAKLFFGQLAEISEEMLPIDFFRCKLCGHLEMFDLDFSIGKQ
jgi:hypothetical protein